MNLNNPNSDNISEFTFVAPLADKDRSIPVQRSEIGSWGPYVYCVNNPLVYWEDLTGKYLVGKDGNPVEIKDGTWSKNVTPEIERMGNAMLKTKVGSNALGRMMNETHPIKVVFSNQSYGHALATTNTNKDNIKKDGKVIDVKINSQTITFYTNTIDKVLNGSVKADDQESQKKFDAYRESCDDVEDAIGAAATHEGSHTTKEGQLTQSKEEKRSYPKGLVKIMLKRMNMRHLMNWR